MLRFIHINKSIRAPKLYLLGVLPLLVNTITYGQVTFVESAFTLGVGHQYGSGQSGGGISLYDFNNDGLDDISLSSQKDDSLFFYKNLGGAFQRVRFPGVENARETKQILWVDYDNDDDNDLLVCSYLGGNILYNNNGNDEFEDVTAASGLPTDLMPTMGATWGDYDNDGDLDLYLCNYQYWYGGWSNYLYQNQGDGTFLNTTLIAGVADSSGYSFCASFIDYDRDGYQDIYVANDYDSGNKLFHNEGNGIFSDKSLESGAGIAIDAMSVTIGDYNNDRWPDIYVTNLPDGNVLLVNNGNGTFSKPDSAAGAGFYENSWGANFYDFDNDMYEDLYVSGMLPFEGSKSAQMYHNNSSGEFVNWANIGFKGDTAWSFANAVGDFNNNGAGDIVVLNAFSDSTMLWKNTNTTDNHWTKIDLIGSVSNKNGIGAIIEVYAGGIAQSRYKQCGEAYLCQNSIWKHFGLGGNETVDSVIIYWPSGIVDKMYSLLVDKHYTVLEDFGITTSVATNKGNFDFSIFPNPSKRLVNFSRPIKCLQVYNSMGVKIDFLQTTNSNLNLGNVQNGVYTLVLLDEHNKIFVRSVLILK